MKEFIELRRKAKEKRDKTIEKVRSDYGETLTRIQVLACFKIVLPNT
jgi:hypothetical protein